MSKKELQDLGASLFGRSVDLIEGDPLEEIFALNLGDFISEHLISDDLAQKIGKNVKDKTVGLKNQLKELVSIYSLDNTLCVLGFSSKEDYVIYNSIAKTITQMLDMDACHVYLTKENAKGLDKTSNDLVLVGLGIYYSQLKWTEYLNSNNRVRIAGCFPPADPTVGGDLRGLRGTVGWSGRRGGSHSSHGGDCADPGDFGQASGDCAGR